jgi:hypothetical protein
LIYFCVDQLFITVIDIKLITEVINLKEGKGFLACSFKGFNLQLLGPVALDLWQHGTSWQEHMVVCLPRGSWETEEEEGPWSQSLLQECAPSQE